MVVLKKKKKRVTYAKNLTKRVKPTGIAGNAEGHKLQGGESRYGNHTSRDTVTHNRLTFHLYTNLYHQVMI